MIRKKTLIGYFQKNTRQKKYQFIKTGILIDESLSISE